MVHGREWFGTADGAGGAWVETGEWEDGWRNLGEGEETTEVLALNGAGIAVEGGRLAGNTTWGTEATHVLRHTVVVGSGQTLTVAAGAVVKVPHGASIRVEDGGRVHFAGIEGNEAVLTGVGDAEWGAAVDCGVWTNDGRATAFSLQSGAAQVTDDGGNVRFGFNPGDLYPTVKLQNGGGKRSDGVVRIPVAVVGTARTNAFRVDWEAVDGSAVFGEDYLLATGTVRWAKSAEGTKNIEIPVDAGRMRGSNVAFTVRVTAHYGCNAAADVAEAVIREFDFPQMQGGAWAGSAAVRFEGREGLAGAVVHGREWFGTADGEGGEWTETGEWADGWREIGDAGASARVLSLNAPEIAVEGGRLAESTTWESNATHLVRNTVVVGSGKTLTIGAGTVVKFLPGTVIKVEDGGKLALQGASGADVLLTSAQDGRFGAAIDCGEWERETVGQDDGMGGIVLQSGSASFADNGWVETLSFRHGAYPYVKLNDTVAFRDGGMAYVPVSIASGSRAGAFSVDWVAVDGTAKFGEDYLLAGGTLSWTNTSQGTKTLQIPLGTDAVRGETTSFTLKLAVCRACNASGSGVCTVTIRELDKIAFGGGTWSGSGAIRFDGRGSVAGRTVNGREWFGEPDGGDGRWTDTAAWGVGWKEIGSGEKTDVLSLNAPDIAVEGGRLAENTTWDSNAVHWVRHWVVVPSGKTLTLGPGAEVRLMDDAGIKVEDGGRLSVQGADGADVAILRGGAEALPEVPGDSGVVEGTAGRIWFQSGSATFADNGWFQAAGVGFSPTNYGSVSIHGAEASRKAGVAYVAVTVGGNARNAPFVVDWEAVPGTATEGRDYLLGGGRVTWNKSSEGTKWIAIPLNTETVAGERRSFTVRLKAVHGMAGTGREATVEIREYEEGDALSGRRGEVAFFEPSEPSAPFAVEEGIRLQPIFRNDAETVRYSGHWQEFDRDAAAALLVTLETDNGKETLKNALPSEEGGFDLDLAKYPVGHYTLKHDIIDGRGGTLATMEKVFSIVDRDDVELHGGALTQNETWTADKVHVVYQTVVVPSVYTLFIEPGTVVKFMTGAGIDISNGGAFFANGIVFTHINDDTVGGDTLSDGYTVAPPMDAYHLTGAFTFGDDTELRGITQNTALTGTISGKKTLSRGSTYRVTGTLTIASGGDLTIPAGTVLKMESGASIVVNSGGTLNAPGTRAAPIVITSIKDDSYSGDTNKDGDKTIPQPGDWEEIKNNGGTINFAHVTALYGGYGQYANQGDAIIRTTGGETRLDCCTVKHSNLRLVGRTGGTVYAENCILADGRWGIDGAATFVNGVIADCNTGANGATLKNTILWACETYVTGGSAANCVAWGETTAVPAGMAYADPLFIEPEEGDFRILESSPCVDAADDALAPETDYFGQPRITLTGGDSPNLVGQLPDIGICEVMPRNVTSDIDLVPRNVRTASNAVPGQLLFVKWEVANAGGSELDAAWRDTVSLVSESGREVVLGDKTTASRIASGGSAFCSGYFTVPAIPDGIWYPKVNVNSYHDVFEGALVVNNAMTGEVGVEVGMETLDPTVAREGVVYGGAPTVLKLRFAAENEDRMVKFRVPAGVRVSWGFGFVPTGASQSGGTTATDGTPIQFLVPEADGEMDVYVVLESDTTESYELSTESTKLTVTGVTPGTLPSSGTSTLTITGAGFGETNAVTLVGAGASIRLQPVEQDTSGNLVATVDCSLLAGGTTYDVRVGSDGREAELPNAVTVAKVEGRGILEARLVTPDSARQGRMASGFIEYANVGNADMPAPIFKLSSGKNGTLFAIRDDEEPRPETMLVGIAPTTPAGILKAGETARLAFHFLVKDNYNIRLSVLDGSSERRRDSVFPEWNDLCSAISEATTALAGEFWSECDYVELYDWAMRKAYGQGTGIVRCMLLDNNTESAIPGATWAIFDTNDCVVATGKANRNGCFAANQLDTNGVYRISVAGWQDDGFWFRPSTLEALDYRYYAAPYCNFAFSVVGAGDDEATIVAIDQDDSRCVYPAERQADGTYRVENLPDGNYVFSVAFAGFHAVTNDYAIGVENGVATNAFAAMEAFAAGRAEVAVKDAEGSPVVGMACLVQSEETGVTVQAVTDGEGVARFVAVPGYYVFMPVADEYALSTPLAFEIAVSGRSEFEATVVETPFFILGTMGAMPLTSEFTFTETNRYGAISLCRWDFDADGTWDATGIVATNIYGAAGDYGVRVGIRLDDGTECVFELADAVRVWDEDAVVVNDGTLLLDEASGWKIDEHTDAGFKLSAIGTVFPAAIYVGQRLVDPENLVNPCEVLEIAALDPLHIKVKTRAVAVPSAYKTLRVSSAAVRVPSKSLLKDILAKPFGTDGDITVASITGKHNFNDWMSIEPSVDVILRVAVDCRDGELLGIDFSAGIRGSVKLSAGNSWEGQTKNKWIKRTHIRKKNAVTKTLPFIDDIFLVGVAPIRVVVRLKGEIALEGSVTAKLNLAAGYTWRKGRGGKPSFNKGFDLASIDVAGSFYVRGGPELYASLGIGRDINGKPYGISALDLSVWGGLMAGLEANVKGSEFEPNDYSAFIGPFLKVESWLLHVQLGGTHEHSVFEWVGLKNEFGIKLLDVDLHYPDFPGIGGAWKTPMPTFTCTQTSLTDTRADFRVASTTSFGEESKLSSRSWDFGDRHDAAANWEVATSFPVVPDDVVVYDIALHEAYKNTEKALNWLPAFDKKAVKKLTVKGRKKQDDGRWSPEDPVVEIEDVNGFIPQSCDPNEMAGPLGAGARRLVAPGEWMTYTVYFENKSDATAAAQEVYVTEQLSGALDWGTFEMVDVGFNNQLDLGLGGKRKGASVTAMTGTAYKVRTELDFDAKTGAAKWYMRIVDESTETRWPRDVYAGFLPPNDATGRGEGHITYRVKLRDDAAAGTEVRAAASIVFDYNAAIETDPAWWNTVAEMGTATVDLGNGVSTNVTVMVGAPWIGQLPDPGKRPGMRFAGWFTGPNGTGSAVTEESVAAAGAKLYAFWDATAAPELWLDVSWGAVEIGTNGVVKGYAPDGSSVEGSANRYVLTGTSRVNGVKFAGGSFTNTWTNLVINLNAKDAVAVTLEGASVEVTLEGDSSIASGEDCAGVRVDAASALVLQGEGRLAAQGGKCGAGIGGGKLQESGRVEIHAGTVEATGGEYGAGIGGGLVAPAAGAVVIAGGSVKARGSEGGEDIGGGFGREGTGAPVGAAGTPVHEVEVPLATDALPAEVVVDLGGGETYRYAGPGHDDDTSLWFWLPDGTYEFAADGDEYGAHVAGTNAAAVFTDPGNANFVAPPVGEVSSEGSAMRAAMDPAYRTSPFEVWTATGLKGHAWDWTPVPPGGYDWDATNAVIRIPDGTNRTRVLRLKFLKR